VEVRKRRPKYGVVESLHVNDAINVVAGSLEREEPFRHRTNLQGIDLIYDGGNHVRIKIRYEKYQYPLLVGDSCPSTILSRILLRKIPLAADDSATSSDDSSDDDAVEPVVARIGMEFRKENSLYRIRSIGSVSGLPSIVTAVGAYPSTIAGKVENFELWRVEQWIEAQEEDE